jgi:hypothetical protein
VECEQVGFEYTLSEVLSVGHGMTEDDNVLLSGLANGVQAILSIRKLNSTSILLPYHMIKFPNLIPPSRRPQDNPNRLLIDNPDITFLLKTPTVLSDGSFFWRMDCKQFFPLIEKDPAALECWESTYEHVVSEAQQVLRIIAELPLSGRIITLRAHAEGGDLPQTWWERRFVRNQARFGRLQLNSE